jgi:hypothetical protein
MPTSTQLASGLGGAIGCDFRTVQNQLIFVEYSTGKLSALNLFPPSTIVAQGTGTVLKGTFMFDFDTGTQSVAGPISPTMDVFWDQHTATVRSMDPIQGAKIINLGAVNFASLTAANLQLLPYATTPIDGNADTTNQLVVGDVFAVLTNKGNYAKVLVTAYGYNLTINWVTYNIGSGYTVLGTGYTNPEDVKLSVDGIHAYVTERSGDLVKVALTSANRSAATVVASGMTAPQQLFLDEAHNAAYVVEYAATGVLLKVNLTSGVKTPVISTLNFPVGVVLSSDLQYAYVTEQTTGAEGGRVSSIQLSTTTRTTLVKNLTAPFFVTWADAVQDQLLVALRDPSHSIINVNVTVTPATSTVVAAGVPTRPSSVALATPGQLLICCDSVIEEINFVALPLAGPLLMGIGFIPFDRINQPPNPLAGLADTTVDPTYFYQVKDTPFGGTLPIMVNYQTAAADGAFYYQVRVDGIPHTDTWTNYLWNGTEYVLETISPITVGPTTALYPVHPLSQLFLWYNTSLGDLLDTTGLSNGQHTIQLFFTDAGGNLLPTIVSAPLVILVNNQNCVATLALPLLSGSPADACGVMHYGTTTTATVTMAFTASQPQNFATFSFSLVRGVTGVTLPTPPPASGPITSAVSPFTATVAALLTTSCPTAGFAGELYVAATINNGWSRQSQYDAEALLGFVLTP